MSYRRFTLLAILVVFLLAGSSAVAQSSRTMAPSTVVVAQTQDIVSFDVARITGSQGVNVLIHVNEPLVMEHPDRSQGIVPWLAESWETPDDNTWIFRLREGVTFHNGEPFTADAVVYSYERYRDPNLPGLQHAYYWDLANMESVTAEDDLTVVIKTSAPSPTMLAVLSQMYITEPKWTSSQSDDVTNRQAVGTGPFKFKSWTRDEQVVLEAFDDYWFGQPIADELVFRVIPEVGTRVAELLTGGVHIAGSLNMDQVSKLDTDTTRASINPGSRIVYLGIVTNDESLPTSNKLVRQAFNYAVDVDTIASALFGGVTEPYAGVLPPPYHDPEVQPYPYDPEKARELLAEAGYPDGFDLVMDSYADRLQVSQAVAKYLTDVGVRTTIRTHEWANYTQRLRDRESSPVYILGQGGFASAFEQLSTIFDPRSSTIHAHAYSNPEFYRVMDAASVTVDEEEHTRLLYEAQRLLWDDAPVIFMYTDPVVIGVSNLLPDYEAAARDGVRLHWTLTEPRSE